MFSAFVVPALRNLREERGTHFVGSAGEIQSPGHPSGEIVKRVEPEYPEDARKEGKQGTVLMRVTIAKDGSVTDVEIMDGDPAFIPAAKAAVMQWHYKPYTNCGEPVEMRTIESLKFSPPSTPATNETKANQ